MSASLPLSLQRTDMKIWPMATRAHTPWGLPRGNVVQPRHSGPSHRIECDRERAPPEGVVGEHADEHAVAQPPVDGGAEEEHGGVGGGGGCGGHRGPHGHRRRVPVRGRALRPPLLPPKRGGRLLRGLRLAPAVHREVVHGGGPPAVAPPHLVVRGVRHRRRLRPVPAPRPPLVLGAGRRRDDAHAALPPPPHAIGPERQGGEAVQLRRV
mmetsp:Transcript_33247/g.106015  ORF Transcript_33247/g.106015 Transcript_33247/m.106015 type:complete len:210 (+) Transcript_33247:148-777(+)